jgi:hypothetical protein
MSLNLGKAGRCLGIGLLILGVLVLWQNLQQDTDLSSVASKTFSSGPKQLAVVQRADSRLLATFAQLKTQAEGLPNELTRVLRRPPFGANWALAQRLPVRVQGRFWAIPARDSICMIGLGKDRVVEMTCTTTKAALQHGVAIVSLDQPETAGEPAARLTVGMAPDGSHTVVIHTGTRTTTGPVANGVFAVHDMATDPPDELTFR